VGSRVLSGSTYVHLRFLAAFRDTHIFVKSLENILYDSYLPFYLAVTKNLRIPLISTWTSLISYLEIYPGTAAGQGDKRNAIFHSLGAVRVGFKTKKKTFIALWRLPRDEE